MKHGGSGTLRGRGLWLYKLRYVACTRIPPQQLMFIIPLTSHGCLLLPLTAENLYKILLTNAVKLNVYFSRD